MEAWDELCAALTRHREIVERTDDELVVAIESTRRRVRIALREAFGEQWVEISCPIGSAQRFDVALVMRQSRELAFGAALEVTGSPLAPRCRCPATGGRAHRIVERSALGRPVARRRTGARSRALRAVRVSAMSRVSSPWDRRGRAAAATRGAPCLAAVERQVPRLLHARVHRDAAPGR